MSAELPDPPPPVELKPEVLEWPRDDHFVRCHSSEYGATEFNARGDIRQRFRPFTARRRVVPTLYGAETVEAALSETLFHAVPTSGSDRRLRSSRIVGWQISRIAPLRDLKLIDLRDSALDSVNLTRTGLIESPASSYERTAAWGSAFFHSAIEPDGLVWNSRQSPSDTAMILFGRGRVARNQLRVVHPPLPLAVADGFDLVQAVGERLGITVVQ